MKIVTGFRSENHITSADWQALNQGIVGTENYVLDGTGGFYASMPTVHTVEIREGDGLIQGVHFRVERGTVDTLELSEGEVGVNRIDLITARYTKDPLTGKENVEWHVIEGTPTSGTPEAPDYIEGDILAGDLTVDFPLYMVEFTGLNSALAQLDGAYMRMANTMQLDERLETAEERLTRIGVVDTFEKTTIAFTNYDQRTLFTIPSDTSGTFMVNVAALEVDDKSIDINVGTQGSGGLDSVCYAATGKNLSGLGMIVIESGASIDVQLLATGGSGARNVVLTAELFRLA